MAGGDEGVGWWVVGGGSVWGEDVDGCGGCGGGHLWRGGAAEG